MNCATVTFINNWIVNSTVPSRYIIGEMLLEFCTFIWMNVFSLSCSHFKSADVGMMIHLFSD